MTETLELDVAKKASKAPEPEQDEPGRKPMVVQVRGSQEWKAWAERLADFDGIPLAMMVDRAFRVYAKHVGFDESPPKR